MGLPIVAAQLGAIIGGAGLQWGMGGLRLGSLWPESLRLAARRFGASGLWQVVGKLRCPCDRGGARRQRGLKLAARQFGT